MNRSLVPQVPRAGLGRCAAGIPTPRPACPLTRSVPPASLRSPSVLPPLLRHSRPTRPRRLPPAAWARAEELRLRGFPTRGRPGRTGWTVPTALSVRDAASCERGREGGRCHLAPPRRLGRGRAPTASVSPRASGAAGEGSESLRETCRTSVPPRSLSGSQTGPGRPEMRWGWGPRCLALRLLLLAQLTEPGSSGPGWDPDPRTRGRGWLCVLCVWGRP